MSIPGVRVDRGGETSVQPAWWASICLATQEKKVGRETGLGIPGPGGRGCSGLPHRKPQLCRAGAGL